MAHYDDHLFQLRQKVAKQRHLESMLKDLQDQRRTYDKKTIELRIAYREEQADVERLEGRSLAKYFYNVIGKLDDKLDQERREVYAAKVKLDAAERELAAIDSEIQEIQTGLQDLYGCAQDYSSALERKRDVLKSSGTAAGAQILEIEERVAVLEAQKAEIQEAIHAGQGAMATVDRIITELDDADAWNTWDMFGGGGIITHMAKHEHLDDAQELVEQLQGKLRKFKTELADIQISADLQVNVDGFLWFADYFFDGLFADWAVGDRISQSQSAVQKTQGQISSMLGKLSNMADVTDREITVLMAKLEEHILQA